MTAEDREHIQAALLEVDGRLSSRINDVQERLSEQVVKTAAQLTAAVEVGRNTHTQHMSSFGGGSRVTRCVRVGSICWQGIRASTTEASQQLDREQHRLAQDVDARLVVLQDNLVQATRSAERASQALAKELSNEVSNMESVVATARQDIDGGLEDVRDRLTEMYLRGVLSAAISDVEMRDIASEYSKSAMNFVLEDHRPMFSSIQADVEELKSRVLTQVCSERLQRVRVGSAWHIRCMAESAWSCPPLWCVVVVWCGVVAWFRMKPRLPPSNPRIARPQPRMRRCSTALACC